MTNAQLQIQAAFGKIVKELEQTRDGWLADAAVNPQDYDDLKINDVYIWFIESF